MIRFLDLERNPCSGRYIAAGRCVGCSETFTTEIEREVVDAVDALDLNDMGARADAVLDALEKAHPRCAERGAA